MKGLFRRFLPENLHKRLHFFRHHADYVHVPKEFVTFFEDGLLTHQGAAFLEDEKFSRAYKLGAETNSWKGASIRWRAYVACWAAQHAALLPGDFVECGVNRGGLARAIVEYVRFETLPKRFFLVDTFKGLVSDYLTSEEKTKGLADHYNYYEDDSLGAVRQTFAPFSNVVILQGAVPDILPDIPAEQVAYLSLDMNCVWPEQKAVEYFWDRMVPGGIILHDDYGFNLHEEQRRMMDQFAASRGTAVLALPTGQGLILKPTPPVA
jgi:O-methyltransferase